MVKEKKKYKPLSLPSFPPLVKAFIYLFWASFSCLSLISFHPNQPYIQNWIGLLGWSLSSILIHICGLVALAFPGYLFSLAVLNFQKKTPGEIRKKHISLLLILVSSSFLLSMLPPTIELPSCLQNKLPKFSLGMSAPTSYIGGIPFYIAYQGQSFCIKHLIGCVGTALLFFTTLLCSVFYLIDGFTFFKKKNWESLLRKQLLNVFWLFKKIKSSLLDKTKYLPKPSIKITPHRNLTLLNQPLIPTVITPSKENRPSSPSLHKDEPTIESAFVIAPHPKDRLKQNPHSQHPDSCNKIRALFSEAPPSSPNQSTAKNKLESSLEQIKSGALGSESSSKITSLPTPAEQHSTNVKSWQPKAVKESPVPSKNSLPNFQLLSKQKTLLQGSLDEELQAKASVLRETLSGFGIDVDLGNICSGPTLTSFEVLPKTGVKVQKILALENDIALKLQASSIRIIAPIPGKAAVGIEIPNPFPQEVNFRDLLEDYQRTEKKLQIPLLLGKKANGENLWADLATMPHLIIAGTTGSGKSVCINTIVMSIIMTTSPNDIKLVIVDPKKVELTGYSGLPHMLSPVVTEAKDAHAALVWLVREMEKRYEILRQLGLRNIQAFNSRKANIDIESSLDIDVPEKMPFIVGIIDELADLLLSASQDMETPIIRLAQMARAVGIHLILATQRPSRDVITGLIKANFPSRISFKVASRVNSQIIIDEPGAENLMGNGDMLFLSPASFGAIRAQGAYLKDEDINRVIQDLCMRFPTQYIVPTFDTSDFSCNVDFSERDPLLRQAKELILQTGNASTTFLQRKLKIGYARAASLMDQLEDAGVIGPSEGAKPRKILSKLETLDDLE